MLGQVSASLRPPRLGDWRREPAVARSGFLSGNAACNSGTLAPRPGGWTRVSSTQADDSVPDSMSLQDALALLGVPEKAGFDEIVRAKKRKLDEFGSDQEKTIQVETAYDLLLMQSLSLRRAGKVADTAVKFADVRPISIRPPAWLTSRLPVRLAQPDKNLAVQEAAVFAVLCGWVLLTGLSAQPRVGFAPEASDVPGAQLALGFGAALFFLRKEEVQLGRASLLVVAGLAGGALFGALIESWLRVDIFPFFGISSPAVVLSEFSLLFLWLTAAFLR